MINETTLTLEHVMERLDAIEKKILTKDHMEIIDKKMLPFDYFREDELPILREAFKDNKYKDVVDFAIGTGMRQGEIIGLKWVH